MSTTLTANQAYIESGSTLDFKDWLNREKEKGTFLVNSTLSSIVEESGLQTGVINKEPEAADQSKKILGINKNVLIISGAIILAAIIVKQYQKAKQ